MHKSTADTGDTENDIMIAMMTMVTLMSMMLNVIMLMWWHVLATLMPKTHPTQLLLSVSHHIRISNNHRVCCFYHLITLCSMCKILHFHVSPCPIQGKYDIQCHPWIWKLTLLVVLSEKGQNSLSTNVPWNKSLNLIFPTKYVTPKSLKSLSIGRVRKHANTITGRAKVQRFR